MVGGRHGRRAHASRAERACPLQDAARVLRGACTRAEMAGTRAGVAEDCSRDVTYARRPTTALSAAVVDDARA